MKRENEITISFIIVNYKTEKYLQNCIDLIENNLIGVNYEIVVVNNDILEVRLPKNIKLINVGENIGYGTACNKGTKIARGEILCFLNPDTEIISGDIRELLNKFDENEKLAIIGPRLVDENGKVQEWIAGKETTIWSIILNNLGYKRDKKIWESKTSIECAWVSGAAMFIRKEIFEKVGGFDEKFFMYFEDIDLCKRVRKLGYKVLYYPEFVIKHFGGKSFLDKKEQKKYYYKAQKYYFIKYFLKLNR